VTGYLAAEGEEAASFHAWAEAWDDGLGWIGFDPMLGLCPEERHVRVATGLDAVSAAPVRSVPAVETPRVVEMSAEGGQ
jgi:transglutaminase-like putative cysteine protease